MAAPSKHPQPAPLAPHSPLPQFYGPQEAREEYVRGLFDQSVRYYDWICGVMSFGSGNRYRRDALERAGLRRGMRLLDVASGTGMVAQGALDLGLPPSEIVAFDPSFGMLIENRRRRRVELVRGLGERLPFPRRSFDFIAMGYALRHVADLAALFAEFRRVVRPGGRVLILEISRPSSRAVLEFLRFYLGRVVPLLARWKSHSGEPGRLMEYYWATIEHCVPPPTILAALEAAGFAEARRQTTGLILSDYLAFA